MNHAWGHHHFPRADNAGTVHSNNKWGRCHQYPKHPGPALNNTNGYNNHQQNHGSVTTQSTAGWDRPGSSSQKWYSSEPEAEEDPDGLPYEPDEEDPELARKRKELQVIEEQIMLKRASIALKTVTLPKTSVKTAKRRRFTENPNSVESNEPLRERVKHILQLRNREIRTYGPKTASSKRFLDAQNDHPLKWRVEAALHQRFVAPPVEPLNCKSVPLPSTPAPHQKEPSPVKKEMKKSDQGFIRFLNVLNKGVDINKLRQIVRGDLDGLPHSTQSHSQNAAQIHSTTSLFESHPLERKKLEEKEQHFKFPPLEKERLEEKEQRPKTEEQHKHLQNILESLGLSLDTDEMSRLSNRTQERLYGKKQNPGEDKTRTDQQWKEEQKYSPAHYTRSSSSSASSSSNSGGSSSRTPSPAHSKRRRSPWSPHRRRRSRSPYRKQDSHRSKSPLPEDCHDPQPQNPPPMQPYPYPPGPYFNPHFPPQIYPHAYSYSQYTTHDNYWIYNQPPAPGLMDSFNPNNLQSIPPVSPYQQTDRHDTHCEQTIDICRSLSMEERSEMHRRNKILREEQKRIRQRIYNQPPAPGLMDSFNPNNLQSIPPVSPYQQIDPHYTDYRNEPPNEMETDSSKSIPEDLQKLSNDSDTRCLVPVKQLTMAECHSLMRSTAESEMHRRNIERQELNKIIDQIRAQEAKRRRNNQRRNRNRNENKKKKDGMDWLRDPLALCTSSTQQRPTDEAKKKKKKKKKQVFIEKNVEVEELHDDWPLPVTRGLGLKNPAKLTESRVELVEMKDVEVPSGELGESGKINAPGKGEEEEKKPKLTEEEIRANLMKKLEAFNTRMKKRLTQPPVCLVPPNVK